MMTLNEIAAELNDRIESLKEEIDEIVADGFDEYYYGKEIEIRKQVEYLTNLRDKILGE